MSIMFVEAGVDVLAVTDPLISQISSDHFEEFVSDPYKKLSKQSKHIMHIRPFCLW